jgi:hypothetical protein
MRVRFAWSDRHVDETTTALAFSRGFAHASSHSPNKQTCLRRRPAGEKLPGGVLALTDLNRAILISYPKRDLNLVLI